jgi:hypothetical protein
VALEFERIGTERYMQPMAMLADTHVVRVEREGDTEDSCTARGWVLDPPFQRGSVWTPRQKVAWIETLLGGLALPAIIVNRFPREHPVYGWKEIVIDGQQRLRATAEFLQDKFKVRGELWSEQDKPFHRSFIMAGPICPVIYCAYETDRECAELYLKLLQAGTAHTPAEIKKAERYVRECGS